MNVLARTFPSTALLCPFFSPQLSGAVAGELPCFLFLLLLDIYQKKKKCAFSLLFYTIFIWMCRVGPTRLCARGSLRSCALKRGEKTRFHLKICVVQPFFSPLSSSSSLLLSQCTSRAGPVQPVQLLLLPPPSLSSFLDVASAILTTGLRFTRRRDDRNTAVRQPLWRSR